MLIKIEIIARKLNMTQCEEIKKKLQKALLVHTLDGKVRKVMGGERALNSGESKFRKENCMLAFGTVEMNSF